MAKKIKIQGARKNNNFTEFGKLSYWTKIRRFRGSI